MAKKIQKMRACEALFPTLRSGAHALFAACACTGSKNVAKARRWFFNGGPIEEERLQRICSTTHAAYPPHPVGWVMDPVTHEVRYSWEQKPGEAMIVSRGTENTITSLRRCGEKYILRIEIRGSGLSEPQRWGRIIPRLEGAGLRPADWRGNPSVHYVLFSWEDDGEEYVWPEWEVLYD